MLISKLPPSSHLCHPGLQGDHRFSECPKRRHSPCKAGVRQGTLQINPASQSLATAHWIPPLSPINISALMSELALHPDKTMVHYLLHCFSHGFSIGYAGHPLSHRSPNLSSAHDHPEIITSYIDTECRLVHTAGPFLPPPFSPFNVNHWGLFPRNTLPSGDS